MKFISKAKGEEVKKEEAIDDKTINNLVDANKDWPLQSQDIIDELRRQNLEIEKEMLNFKYLYNVRENDYKRVNDQYINSLNDISFLKEGKHKYFMYLVNNKLRVESDIHEKLTNTVEISNKESLAYIQILESDNETLKNYIK